jgi:ABC-type nitrate/sulfonate/bicarbonate transport system permease component
VLQPPPSIVVRVVEQPVHETTISDVIFGSLGLVGVMLLAAALMGLLLGGGLILFKRLRRKDALDAEDDGTHLRVTPTS